MNGTIPSFSAKNANYISPKKSNINSLKAVMNNKLQSLVFTDGVSIDVTPHTVLGFIPALRVDFKGDIYKPNYNSKIGPLKDYTYYDIIIQDNVIQQASIESARKEDIKIIVDALSLTLKEKVGGGRRKNKTRNKKRTKRRSSRKN